MTINRKLQWIIWQYDLIKSMNFKNLLHDPWIPKSGLIGRVLRRPLWHTFVIFKAKWIHLKMGTRVRKLLILKYEMHHKVFNSLYSPKGGAYAVPMGSTLRSSNLICIGQRKLGSLTHIKSAFFEILKTFIIRRCVGDGWVNGCVGGCLVIKRILWFS